MRRPALARIALVVFGSLFALALLGPSLAGGAGGTGAALEAELATAAAPQLLGWWSLATRNVAGVVVASTCIAALLGTPLGALSVYGGGAAAGWLFRFVELVGAIPGLILVGVLRFGDSTGGVLSLIATLALLRTLEVAQLVRSQVLATLPSDFVEASRALGASRRWQIRVHVLPRLARPLAVNLLLGASALIGLEAALSFTGLGMPEGVPSWGRGLAALATGSHAVALVWVIASIGLTSALLYGLGARLAEDVNAPLWPPAAPPSRLELGAERQGS